MRRTPLFHRVTEGIRITVRPAFLPSQSDPASKRYVFGYHVRIENLAEHQVQLLTRRWLIHDDVAGEEIVEGAGVVGEQPVIPPGAVHEYRSFCVLEGVSGWMEGSYHFIRADSTPFSAVIPRFLLQTGEEEVN